MQPHFDADCGRIIEGYSILQPLSWGKPYLRDAHTLRTAERREPGIDPAHSRDKTDAYQDLFAEGSFIGKGHTTMSMPRKGSCVRSAFLPENRILSHDLLEGCYERGY